MKKYNSKWHSTLCADSRIGGRAENQDCIAFEDTPFGLLSVVCDGMGGGKAGRNASTLASQAVWDYCKQAPAAKRPDVVLTEAVVHAQSVLRQTIKEHPELLGMGTTCVAAIVTQKKAAIVHVGDSRCYVLRGEQIAFRTQDHSVVGEMVRKGELTEEDARRAQGSNVITRALGIKENVEPETHFIDILPDDRIVLCTDGLWGHFSEAELVRMCSLPQPIDVLLPLIMDQAELHGQQQPNGNYDNLSLSMIQMNGPKTAKLSLARKAANPDTAAAAPLPQPKALQWRKPAFLIATALVVALTGIGAYYFGVSRSGGEDGVSQPVPESAMVTDTEKDPASDTFVHPDEFADEVVDTRHDSLKQLAEGINEGKKVDANDVADKINELFGQVKSLQDANGESKNAEDALKNRKEILKDIKTSNKAIYKAIPNDVDYKAIYIELNNEKIQNLLIATQKDNSFALTEASREYNEKLLERIEKLLSKYKKK